MGNRAYNLSFACSGRSIKQEGAHELREALAHEQRAKWENNILGDELSDQGHGGIIGRLCDIVQHRVNIVELTNKIFQLRWRKLLDNIVLNQLDKQIIG
jgi:hypothetical protein